MKIFSLEKIGSENKLARTYGTSWFLYDGAEPLDTNVGIFSESSVHENHNHLTRLFLHPPFLVRKRQLQLLYRSGPGRFTRRCIYGLQ
jgi:hypothetical protein